MHLRLALALELGLLLVPQLLVELGSLAGLVAVHLRGQGSVDLAQAVLLAELVVALLLALLLTLELVGNSSLILCVLLVYCSINKRGEGYGGVGNVSNASGMEELTGVLSLVRVLLALVEAVLLLHLLDLGVFVVALVTGLVDLGVTDVGCSGHCDVC
jgi:hypothetical protein